MNIKAFKFVCNFKSVQLFHSFPFISQLKRILVSFIECDTRSNTLSFFTKTKKETQLNSSK